MLFIKYVLRSSRQVLDYWTYLLIKDTCFQHFSASEAPVYFTSGSQVSCSVFKFTNSLLSSVTPSQDWNSQIHRNWQPLLKAKLTVSFFSEIPCGNSMPSDSSESWNKWAPSFHWTGEIQVHILHVNNPLFPFFFLEVYNNVYPLQAGNSKFCNQTVKVQLWVQLRWNIALLKLVGVLLLTKVSPLCFGWIVIMFKQRSHYLIKMTFIMQYYCKSQTFRTCLL